MHYFTFCISFAPLKTCSPLIWSLPRFAEQSTVCTSVLFKFKFPAVFLGFCPRAVTFGADAALWSADWIVACLRACSSVFKTRVALSNRNSLVCFDRDEYPMHAEWNEALGLPRSSIWLRIDVELVSSPLYYYNFSWIVRVLSEASTHKGLQ